MYIDVLIVRHGNDHGLLYILVMFSGRRQGLLWFFVNTARGLMVKHRKDHGSVYMLVIFGSERPALIWGFYQRKACRCSMKKAWSERRWFAEMVNHCLQLWTMRGTSVFSFESVMFVENWPNSSHWRVVEPGFSPVSMGFRPLWSRWPWPSCRRFTWNICDQVKSPMAPDLFGGWAIEKSASCVRDLRINFGGQHPQVMATFFSLCLGP